MSQPRKNVHQALGRRRRTSANRIDLIEDGLDANEREKIAFFEIADRLVHTSDDTKQKQLKEELARMTLGRP